jgi:succinoglycan biosynthesis protein ExoA
MSELPFVSVIMPVRNEAKYIERSLGAVLAQDYPADRMEVIVADGMSDDGTRDIIANLKPQAPSSNGDGPTVKLIDNPKKIVAAGLNRAIEESRGEVIVHHLTTDGIVAVGGCVETVAESDVARVIASAMSSKFGVGDSAFRTHTQQTMYVETVPFPAYTRAVIDEVGAFDEEQVRNQDDEFNYRLRECGYTILLSVDIRSKYYSRSTFSGLFRQYFQYGFWKVRVMQKHPRQMQPRQFVPPVFVLSIVAGVAGMPLVGSLPVISIVGAYAATNLIASVGVAARKGWKLLPLLPVSFATLHVSYGLGFLVGLVKFWNMWGKPGRVPERRNSKTGMHPVCER